MTKGTIAHELGHIIVNEVLDGMFITTKLVLNPSEGSLAYVEYDNSKRKKCKYKLGKVESFMDLGGIFGELVYYKKVSVWGARADLDSFTSVNIRVTKSKQKIVKEIYTWLWINKNQSLFRVARLPTIKQRDAFAIPLEKFQKILPITYKVYLDFLKLIDEKEFITVVNDIFNTKKATYNEADIQSFISKITRIKN